MTNEDRPGIDRSAALSHPIDRRSVLRGAAVVGAGVAAAAALARTGHAQDATSAQTPPDATPLAATPTAGPGGSQIVTSTVEGVPDVYLTSPQPFTSYEGVPGSGGSVRVFMISYSPPPPARDQNQYWQELEKRLGVTWEIDLTPQPSYGEKSATYFAGGDLPDLFYLNPEQNAPQQYQAMAQGAFLDLEPYVTGDALQQFKNLATFPQYAWDNARFQGTLYGVPKVQPKIGNLGFYRSDWARKFGVTPNDPESLRSFLTQCTTGDPDGNGNPDTWGSGRFENGWRAWDNASMSQMFRVPFNWRRNDDGTLTYMIETDEYRQFLQYQAELYAAGAFHPDAAGMTFSDAQNAFIAGETGFHYEGFPSFYGTGSVTDRMQQANAGGTDTYITPVGSDGQPGIVYNGVGHFGYVGIPASLSGNDDRINELLRILDYLAAPFGSEEFTFLNNGIEGVHSDRNAGGNLILNDRGRSEKSDLPSPMNGLPVFFYPEDPTIGLAIQQGGYASVGLGIDDPTLGLYSAANIENGPALTQLGTDTVTAIITGRQGIDSLDAAIEEWKSRGGDQIRQDFQEALQQQG
jgi:putative aldouronate transport system substrate-binding protein